MRKEVFKMAVYQYPIQRYRSVEEWKERMEGLVMEGCAGGQKLLLFPEFGSLDLMSLLSDPEQKDMPTLLEEVQSLLPVFKSHFRALAIRYGVVIVAPSFPQKEGKEIYNRVFVFSPSGKEGFQDKWWMTRFEAEEWQLTGGEKELTVFDTGICKFGIQNCYDVEFSIGSYCLTQAGAEVILVPSCTKTIQGSTRVHVGARARALEFQCYSAVAQVIGTGDEAPMGSFYGYPGFYTTPDRYMPEEGIFAVGEAQTPGWWTQELDLSLLERVRRDGQMLNYKDHQRVRMEMAEEPVLVKTVDMR